MFHMGFPGSSVVKNRPANARDVALIPGLGRSPGEGNGNPLSNFQLSIIQPLSITHYPTHYPFPNPVSLPGKSHGQRSLVGYSPWGHKELHTAEQLSMHTACVSYNVWDTCVLEHASWFI